MSRGNLRSFEESRKNFRVRGEIGKNMHSFDNFQVAALYGLKKNEGLCLAHIKIHDRAIKILSVGRPIYQVWLPQIGRWRAFTLKICTADHSWELVCFASVGHRPFIARQSGDYRPMIERAVTHKYICVHAYYITMLTYNTGRVI